MQNGLILFQPQAMAALTTYATAMVQSGFLPSSVKTAQQAIAIITLGQELGITPWMALNGINVISGKPTVSPQLMLALINKSGLLEDMAIDGNEKYCTVTMKRKGRTVHAETFTIEDAQKMKTTEGYGDNKKTIPLADKFNWKTMPAVMLKWRAVAACARVVFPDVVMGLYTTEEIAPDSVTVDDNGDFTYEAPAQLQNGKHQEGTQTQYAEITHALGFIKKTDANNRPYMIFDTEDGRRFASWTRQPFKDAGWIEEDDWLDVKELTFDNAIPVKLEPDGNNWKLAEVLDPFAMDATA